MAQDPGQVGSLGTGLTATPRMPNNLMESTGGPIQRPPVTMAGRTD